MKLRSIKFIDHPIIGDLSLDFTVHGKPVDTVIFAGENGTGKSTILNLIMSLSTHDLNQMRYISEIEIEDNGHNEKLVTRWTAKDHFFMLRVTSVSVSLFVPFIRMSQLIITCLKYLM